MSVDYPYCSSFGELSSTLNIDYQLYREFLFHGIRSKAGTESGKSASVRDIWDVYRSRPRPGSPAAHDGHCRIGGHLDLEVLIT